jgi:NAD(P)-dependent dehydrogenase (short-subunit alcohol dehydrogenase family)
MSNRLKDKVAVVTGSGRGIGKSMALSLAGEGAKVVVNARSKSTLGNPKLPYVADEVVDEITRSGGVAAASYDSVISREAAENIIKTAINKFGRLDILVNNAGNIKDRMVWNMSDEEWDDVIKTHLYGHFYCTRAASSYMREAIKEGKLKNGRIINESSYAGVKGNAGQPNYSAAKGGVIAFTYSCALALWKSGITTNCIVPRALTSMSDSIPDDRVRTLAASRGITGADTLPLDILKKKFIGGSPDAIGPLVCWLAGDDAQNINGQIFLIMEGQIGVFSQMIESKMAYRDGIFDVEELWRVMPLLTTGLVNPAAGA